MQGIKGLPEKFHGITEKLPIDLTILQVLALVSILFPFVNYMGRTGSDVFTLSGLNFIQGATIVEGRIVLEPFNGIITLIAVFAIIGIIVSLVFPIFKRKKLITYILLLVGLLQLVMVLGFNVYINEAMRLARNVNLEIGIWIIVIIGILTIVRSLFTLYMNKHLCALDFFVIPGIIYFFINNYIPMVGIYIAFLNVDFGRPLWESEFHGIRNFEFLFRTPDVWIMTRNTVLYNGVFIILNAILGVSVAICLNEIIITRLKKTYQTLILLPQLISIIIVAYIGFAFLSTTSGFINSLLEERINFYATPFYWPFILTTIQMWRMLGYNSLIYLAAVVGVDKSLYEAAHVDGAGKFKQIWHITIPMIRTTIIMLTLLGIGRIFYTDFGLFFQVPMEAGALIPVTQTTDTFVFRALFRSNNIGMAAAASTYQAIVGFTLILIANKLVSRVDKGSALF